MKLWMSDIALNCFSETEVETAVGGEPGDREINSNPVLDCEWQKMHVTL